LKITQATISRKTQQTQRQCHTSPGGSCSPPGSSWYKTQNGYYWCAAWRHLHARQAVSGRNPEFPEKQRQKEKEFMQLYKTVH